MVYIILIYPISYVLNQHISNASTAHKFFCFMLKQFDVRCVSQRNFFAILFVLLQMKQL